MIAGDLLGERARLTPEKPALIEVRSGRRFSYAVLDQRAAALARFWTGEWGLAKGDRVALLAENRVEYVDAFFAAGKSGVVLVPLSTRLAAPELAALLEDAEPRLVLYTGQWKELALAVQKLTPPSQWLAIEELPLDAAHSFRPVACDPEDLWCLLYTSGTTGRPKGVMLPHRMILWNACNTVLSWQLREDDIAPIFTPMYHAGGLAVFLTPLVAIGGTIVLHERFDASEVWRSIERERATLLFGVPTTFQRMREAPEFATIDCGCLRWAISGGAPLPRYLIDDYQSRGVAFKQGYGLTEAGVNCFAMTTAEAARKPGSIGKPMMFTEVRLSNGELWLRGPHVAQGFWKQPEATRAAIDAEGWLHTGDLAHWDEDGFYYIDGRIKEMFISGGVNVYPAEIENVLLQHPAIADAAVLGVPDAQWGEAGVAFLVFRGDPPSETELLEFLEARLARFKLPKEIRYIEALPRTAYGKVVRPELLRLYQSG
ncbi:MAG: long-chain fatty acid--CoA ligase [Terriglobia bacterium]|nr:MAG: long-chain fatty acid--CoA ligase [Terriglobia bacterium]